MDQAISIDEFQKKLKRYEGHSPIFYRGQLKRFPDISSSISRDIGYMSNEHNIYQEAIHLKSDEFKKYSTPLEHLAKMQHYEIPTRLIDVTINPLYALFFAVEDVEDESPGLVYIFIQQPKELNSKEIQLLSLLATIEDLQIGHIQHLYEQTFHEQIEHHEILQIVNGSYFVPYTAKLQEANTRLFNQQGTFVICGNLVSEGEIQKDLLTLNSIKPSLIISVPYEYKETIKKELDAAHNINKATVYPELPSVAKYLKEKYKEINLSLDGTYSITEEQDISYPGVRRVSIKITLTKLLKINEIHSAVRYLINEYKGKYDVVSVFVAKTGEDYILYNWILRYMWCNPLNDNIQMQPLKQRDKDGYSWDESNTYSVMADYNDKYVFENDKHLFVYKKKLYDEVQPIHKELVFYFNDHEFQELFDIINIYISKINEIYFLNDSFGVSRNIEFKAYLSNFTDYFIALDNIYFWANKENLNERQKAYHISRCFEDAHNSSEEIVDYISYWQVKLAISENDYNSIDPYTVPERATYKFEPTIPINPDGIEVDFNVEVELIEDRALHIFGTTNLFNHESLLINVRKQSGQLCGSNKASVMAGHFDFGIFNFKGNGYVAGLYFIEMSLSLPSIQPKLFQNKAGIEYENLKGPYVDRTVPMVKYRKEISVE